MTTGFRIIAFGILASLLVWSLVGCEKDGSLPELPSRVSDLPLVINFSAKDNGIVKPTREEDGAQVFLTWETVLSVGPQDSETRIVEFGHYAWIDGKWEEIHFDVTDYKADDGTLFSEWFACPEAVLKPGKVYRSSDFTVVSQNWIPDTKTMIRIYLIGENADGRVRGEVALEHLPPD